MYLPYCCLKSPHLQFYNREVFFFPFFIISTFYNNFEIIQVQAPVHINNNLILMNFFVKQRNFMHCMKIDSQGYIIVSRSNLLPLISIINTTV